MPRRGVDFQESRRPGISQKGVAFAWLCYRAPGGHDPQLQRLQEAQVEADIQRKLGYEVICPCGTKEGKDGTKKFKVHMFLLVRPCRKFREKDSRAAKVSGDGK
jgi:hypothetical protein